MQKISCPATKFYFWAGETPTPQEIIVIVEQASCLLLTENNCDCGTGILPVPERGTKKSTDFRLSDLPWGRVYEIICFRQ